MITFKGVAYRSLADIPQDQVTVIPETVKKEKPKKPIIHNGERHAIIPLDSDGASAGWGMNVAMHEGN